MESEWSVRQTPANNQHNKRRKRSLSSLEDYRRSKSEGTKRAQRLHDVSRQSSTESSVKSLEVRCACQYFQCDSLLPERLNPIGTRPSSRTSNTVVRSRDHEYEPINPPPEDMMATIHSYSVPNIGANLQSDVKPISQTSSTTSLEHQYLQVPPNKELVPRTGDTDESATEEQDTPAQNIQNIIEERYFNSTTEKENSKSKTDVAKNQRHSPALEFTKTKTKEVTKMKPNKQETSIHQSLRNHAAKLKTKLFKSFPQRSKPTPKTQTTTKISRIKIIKPKTSDKSKKSFPSFSLPNKGDAKSSLRERQLSTESNAGDSKTHIFDFRTYPRIFDRSKKDKNEPEMKNDEVYSSPPEFATVPRVSKKKWSGSYGWNSKVSDTTNTDESSGRSKELENENKRDSIRIPLHPESEEMDDVPSPNQYDEDIDMDDDYERDNHDINSPSPFAKDFLKRWDHGEFHEGPKTNQIQDEDKNALNKYDTENDVELQDIQTPLDESFEIDNANIKPTNSSDSLSGEHRRGVLEEIDSDEFFLREKGISQDNIEVGKYLSSEIREAFRNPVNALSHIEHNDFSRQYDEIVSDQSETVRDAPVKRKSLKKPKRKKTPHVSREEVSFERDTSLDEFSKPLEQIPPARPKRKSKKSKKKKITQENIIPYQETIAVDEPFAPIDLVDSEVSNNSHDNILSDYHQNRFPEDDDHELQMYENEHMKGIDQPEINVIDAYYRYENYQQDFEESMEDINLEDCPIAPVRRHRSVKSSNASDHDSIIEELNVYKNIPEQEIEAYRAEQHEYIIPTPEPPVRPKRVRSCTRSPATTPSILEEETTLQDKDTDSFIFDNQQPCVEEPCVEETCIQDLRDCMGYAIIDKRNKRDPSLPPTRFPPTPPRNRRSFKKQQSLETKFSTVPRSTSSTAPERPLRNYSTLGGPKRPPRKRSTSNTNDEAEKENIIRQHIEIEDDEPVRRLQSGDIIQKMRDRPLPAPPRPPRKSRCQTKDVLQDITQSQNIISDFQDSTYKPDQITMEEPDDFSQTQPLEDDFISDEILQDIEDQIIAISEEREADVSSVFTEPTQQKPVINYEETITHATLVVQPINDAQVLPREYLTHTVSAEELPRERIIHIEREIVERQQSKDSLQELSDNEESSEIPEEFFKLKSATQNLPEEKHVVLEKAAENLCETEKTSALHTVFLPATRQENEPIATEVENTFSKTETYEMKRTENLGDLEEASEVPEEFFKLRNFSVEQSLAFPTRETEQDIEISCITEQKPELHKGSPHTSRKLQHTGSTQEVEILKATKVQVQDLDVDKLRVNELQANKIIVSEIDGITLQVSEINSKSGNLMLSGIELPPQLLQDLLDKAQSSASHQCTDHHIDTFRDQTVTIQDPNLIEVYDTIDEKKTLIDDNLPPSANVAPQKPLRQKFIIETVDVQEDLADYKSEDVFSESEAIITKNEPVRPSLPQRPRRKTEIEKVSDVSEENEITIPVPTELIRSDTDSDIVQNIPQSESPSAVSKSDEELPPPRPPQPTYDEEYVPSQPPASFFALKSQPALDFMEEKIPLPPRRKQRQLKAQRPSGSSSEDVPPPLPRKMHRSLPEPSIPQLTGQLVRACATNVRRSYRQLVQNILNSVLQNTDDKQDIHVMIIILLVLIAGLLLLDGDNITIHHHHWDYFSPPENL